MAQLGSAPALGAGGRWFKSSRPDKQSTWSGPRSETPGPFQQVRRAPHVPLGYDGSVTKRRQFGKIRKLPSGRYQASYLHPISGRRATAPQTFRAKADASSWLATIQADLSRGDHLDEDGGRTDLGTYAEDWLHAKAALRLRTVELYSYLLRSHILPTLGDLPVGGITAPEIRSWHAALLRTDLSQATVAKAYRLLRQIMQAAVDDRLRRENPCRIKGTAVERGPERKIPTVESVLALADAISPNYRAMVLLAGYSGLRRGECLGLARRHVNLSAEPPTVTIERALVYTQAGDTLLQEPKTDAGYRTVAVPASLAAALSAHLDEFVEPHQDALLFTDPTGAHSPTTDRFRNEWEAARRTTKVSCTFHDLRHVAGTLNAIAGATTKEAMARLGHASPGAALRYQHAVEARDHEIARAVEQLLPNATPDNSAPG